MKRARIAAALITALAGLAVTGTALAAEPPVIDQYNEPLPTGGGNDHTGENEGGSGQAGGTGGSGGSNDSGGEGSPLPSSTQSNLQDSVSAPVATSLQKIATSEELGAPQERLGSAGKRDGEISAASGADGGVVSEAVAAAKEGGSDYLLALGLALMVITLACGTAAVVRRSVSTS
jgi:hypothetical protein